MCDPRQTARDRRVEIGCEFAPRRSGRGRQSANDKPRTGRQLGKAVGAQMLELSAHSITHHCAADLTPDHEAGSGSGKGTVSALGTVRELRNVREPPSGIRTARPDA